jgi:hypothetical protein
VVVAVTAVVGLAGCADTLTGHAVRGSEPAQLDETSLDQVLLPIDELNDIVGAADIAVTAETDEMDDHSSQVSDPACLSAIFPAEQMDYLFTTWTAVRSQVAQDPGEDNQHWAQQVVVLYQSSAEAQSTFEISKSTWQDCAGSTITVRDDQNQYVWHVGDLVDGDLIAQTSIQDAADGWACQLAMSVVSNLTAEVKTCGYRIGDEAVTIARKLITNAAS